MGTDLTTGEAKKLTEKFDGEVFTPISSPDGKWIAFSSFDAELNANFFIVSFGQMVLIQATLTNQEIGASWRQPLS